MHEDTAAFEVIIDKVAKENEIRRDVLEKDYYVTLILEELSKMDNQNFAYFKGGIALYKCLHSIKRFSEDIDLTVYVDDCKTENQKKKRLKQAAAKYKSLPKLDDSERVDKSSIIVEYLYNSMFDIDKDDSLQRFGNVKIEATSFTVSEPIKPILISAHLYELSNDQDKQILEDQYDVKPFPIETITLERIIVDKIFAAEFYYERDFFDDVAKHIYDITTLLKDEKILSFIQDKSEFKRIVEYKRKEELERKGGVDSELAMKNFQYFDSICENKRFIDAFHKMQNIYVFNNDDILSIDDVCYALKLLQSMLD